MKAIIIFFGWKENLDLRKHVISIYQKNIYVDIFFSQYKERIINS